MTKKILFYGDIACDLVIRTEEIPTDGHDITISDLDLQYGGSSANSAAVAAALGAEAYYMGFIGNDIYSQLLLDDLKKNHVKTDFLKQVDGKSTMIIAMINHAGDRSMLSYRGVNAEYAYEADFDKIVQTFDAIHVSGYCLQNDHSKATAIALVDAAAMHKIPVSIDPSFLSSNIHSPELASMMSQLIYIFPNRSEAQQITNELNFRKQADKIHSIGIAFAVLKLDEKGCYISHNKNKDQPIEVSSYPQPNLANSVGAGDAFCAGFLVAHLQGFSLKESGKIGNASAHIILAGNGGRDHLPIQERMQVVLSQHGDASLYKKFYKIN